MKEGLGVGGGDFFIPLLSMGCKTKSPGKTKLGLGLYWNHVSLCLLGFCWDEIF